jgi:hypothetical protein
MKYMIGLNAVFGFRGCLSQLVRFFGEVVPGLADHNSSMLRSPFTRVAAICSWGLGGCRKPFGIIQSFPFDMIWKSGHGGLLIMVYAFQGMGRHFEEQQKLFFLRITFPERRFCQYYFTEWFCRVRSVCFLSFRCGLFHPELLCIEYRDGSFVIYFRTVYDWSCGMLMSNFRILEASIIFFYGWRDGERLSVYRK